MSSYRTQAKLKSLHEVVVRNRLEQLRKRQRDEALQAQNELLARVATSSKAHQIPAPSSSTEPTKDAMTSAEGLEPYDRSMSPVLIDITELRAEDRQANILTEAEDRRALVRLSPNIHRASLI